MALNSPLEDIIRTVGLTDVEIRRVTRDAAAEARRMIASMPDGPSIRKAQLDLARLQAEMWGSIGDATRVGIGDAFDASAAWQARWDHDFLKLAGISGTHWQQSMLATSRQGIESYIGRKHNTMTLSDRVYRNRAMSRGYVDRAINNGLLLGKSVKEIADDVYKYISPTAPGGAAYSAHRLARTEVTNAYHESSKARYRQTPWIEQVQWNVSGSHPRPDVCDEYAEDVRGPGWDAGVYKVNEVPEKPHPQCLCYITPVQMDLDKYAKNFKAGKYDDYIDQQMGCARIA